MFQPRLEIASPKDAAHVYWVGHSLMNGVDKSVAGAQNIMQLVGTLARSRSQSYSYYDHTYYGSALSFNWRGASHGVERSDAKPRADRAYLEAHGGEYDAFVFTEVAAVDSARKWLYTNYYLRKFYCAALTRNPQAEVFLYQSWRHLQPKKPNALDFESQIRWDRKYWELAADESLSNRVANPGRFGRWLDLIGIRDEHCAPSKAFRFIPAGNAMLALSAELSRLGDQAPPSPTGSPLTLVDIFANAASNWAEYRRGEASTLTLRHPDRDHDSVHLSATGDYFVALVSYATIYATDPTGLPAVNGVSQEVAALLQRVAWRTVINEPRSGVVR